MRLLIPAYFAPEDPAWDRLISGLSERGGECIINPDSGPGDRWLVNGYPELCARLRKAGIEILGYAHTSYGKRDPSSDIVLYRNWYGVFNVFLDEVSSDHKDLEFYRALYQTIPGKVVLNHGTVPDEGYLDAGDVLVIFEGDFQTWRTTQFPGWIGRHPKNRFAQIVHTAHTKPQMRQAMTRISKTSSYAYVTDDSGDNPYDRLPEYFQAIV